MTRMAYVLSMVALLAPLRSATADETEAKEILAQAQAAVKAAKSMSLEVSFLGDGVLGKTLPVMDATVVMMRGESGKEPMVQIQGEKTMFRANSAMPFRYVSDGVTAAFADDFRRIYSSGTLADANQLQERIRLVPPYFLSSDAFARELNAFQLSLAEPREIAGVKCHTIEVTYDKARSQRATICIGEDDLLVRSVVTPQAAPITRGVQPNGQSAEIFMARNIMLNPEVDKKSFSLPLPKGYRVLPFAQPTPRRSTGMLAVGSKAPDWTLQDADGKDVTLKSLRGQVVVIDFWASWCGPCKMAMPFLQKLHDKYKTKPVKVFSVNCRERRGDAMARKHIKDNNLTYPQLFNGDTAANAYMVRGIPTMYVIGTDGKILHSERGFRADLVQTMSRVIDEHLTKSETANADEKAPAKSEKTAKAG